jgi:hypothetical protein
VHHETIGSQALPGQAHQSEEAGITRGDQDHPLPLGGPPVGIGQAVGQGTDERYPYRPQGAWQLVEVAAGAYDDIGRGQGVAPGLTERGATVDPDQCHRRGGVGRRISHGPPPRRR